jgi:hypothetical protein
MTDPIDPQPGEFTYTLKIPFNMSREELTANELDIDGARSLTEELQWLVDNVRNAEECDRIMRCAVMLRSRTRTPLNQALRQAVIWERG